MVEGKETKETKAKRTTGKQKITPPNPTGEQPHTPLFERMKIDLSYEAGSEAQKEAWAWLKDQFAGTRHRIFNTLEHSKLAERITETDEFILYKFSMRTAERWANAAIAKDWKPDHVFDKATIIVPEYPIGIQADAPEVQRLCHAVGALLYEGAITIAQGIPEGRYASLYATEIQVARGWLMDAINMNSNRMTRRKPKTLFNIYRTTP